MSWLRNTYNRIRQAQVFEGNRQTVDENPPPSGLHVFEEASDPGDKENAERTFRKITEEDLYNYSRTQLIETMCLSNGTASRLWDDFVTFGTLGYKLSCDTPRGQRMLDKFRMDLEARRNPFEFSLRQLFSQIVLRGNYCFEVVLDDNRMLYDFAAVDPDLFRFRRRKDAMGVTIWELYQYGKDGKPIVIDSPMVHFEAINALPGKRKGTALIGPAMPSIISNLLMMQDLRKVVHTHAFLEKYWSLNHVELKKAGYTYQQVQEIMGKSEAKVESIAQNKNKSKVPVVSAQMELKQYSGAGADAGRGLGFIEQVQAANDNETMRGGMTTPINLGIQNYQAETSARIFNVRDSLRIGSHQESVEEAVSDKLTLGLRAQGIRRPAVLRLERNNAEIRLKEAEVYKAIAEGIETLTKSDVPVDLAVGMVEMYVDLKLPENIVKDLKERMQTEGMEGNGADSTADE